MIQLAYVHVCTYVCVCLCVSTCCECVCVYVCVCTLYNVMTSIEAIESHMVHPSLLLCG